LIRGDLGVKPDRFFTDRPVTDLDDFTRNELQDAIESRVMGSGSFQETIRFSGTPFYASVQRWKTWVAGQDCRRYLAQRA
jgi:hypothetical protein